MASNTSQIIEVMAVYAPGTYEGRPSYKNDIAIIELEKHIKINHYASPVCQPLANPTAGSIVYLSGFGKVGENYEVSDKLKFLKATILASPCELAEDNDVQMCATSLKTNQGLCNGDSGGPVVSFVNGFPELIGVITMKVGKCGQYGTDVLTRVYPFKQWIKQIIRKQCERGIIKFVTTHFQLCPLAFIVHQPHSPLVLGANKITVLGMSI